MPTAPGGQRRAFTLVELLVVIGIITLLAAILVPAVYMAIRSAKNGRMALEVAAISKALERYKLEYGEYPPDFSSTALIKRPDERALAARMEITNHLQRIFRRRDTAAKTGDWPRRSRCIKIDTASLAKLNPSNALFFWLRGFSPDPTLPLIGGGARQPFLDFNEGRLTDSQQVLTYRRDAAGNCVPYILTSAYYPDDDPRQTPYLYYRAASYAAADSWAADPDNFVSGQRPVRPYLSATGMFAEPEKFQVISAGLDGEYGPGVATFPNGPYVKPGRDNITSFSGGKTLENAKP